MHWDTNYEKIKTNYFDIFVHCRKERDHAIYLFQVSIHTAKEAQPASWAVFKNHTRLRSEHGVPVINKLLVSLTAVLKVIENIYKQLVYIYQQFL